MDYNEFFRAVRERGVELRFDNSTLGPPARLSNEALFHLPLIAMTILILAKDRRKPKVDELGQLVGECFERTFAGFRGSSQHLGWSSNLRVRTVRALTFLEQASLVKVEGEQRKLVTTNAGRAVISAALASESDLSYTLRLVERNYRNICVEKQMILALV